MGTPFLKECRHGHRCMFLWTSNPTKQVARTAEVVFKAQWNHMLALLVCRAALSCLFLCCLASLLLWFFRNICGNPALSSANGSAVLLLWLSLKQGFLWAVLSVDQCRCQNVWQSSVTFAGFVFLCCCGLGLVDQILGFSAERWCTWCLAVLLDRMELKYGPQWLQHHGRRASLQIHFTQYEISGMTVCEPEFSVMSFPLRSRDNLSTIWKVLWVLVCFLLVGQWGMKKGMEGREPGIWVLAYLQSAVLSPNACARTFCPSVHLAPAWGTSWVFSLSRKSGLHSRCKL